MGRSAFHELAQEEEEAENGFCLNFLVRDMLFSIN
jgi:hypothetical protein